MHDKVHSQLEHTIGPSDGDSGGVFKEYGTTTHCRYSGGVGEVYITSRQIQGLFGKRVGVQACLE